MKVIGIIPARLESSRLPRKLLLAETRVPLFVHTLAQARKSKRLSHVVVACDREFANAYSPNAYVLENAFWNSTLLGGTAFYITGDHPNGTSRIAEVAQTHKFRDADLIVNIQGDEPEIQPEHIDSLVAAYQEIPGCDLATLATPGQYADLQPKSVVKVRLDKHGYAREFSRNYGDCEGGDGSDYLIHRHLGLYAYSPRFLNWFAAQPPSIREQYESLEQLRALDAGCRIRVALVDHPYCGIDTRQDYDAFVERFRRSCS